MKKGGERLKPLNYSTHKDFIDLVKEMKSVITKSEKEKSKFDKDDCIKNIREFRQRLYQLDPCTMRTDRPQSLLVLLHVIDHASAVNNYVDLE